MCGRFSQTATPAVIAEQFAVSDPLLFTPRYNIAPSQSVVAIWADPETFVRQLVFLREGAGILQCASNGTAKGWKSQFH